MISTPAADRAILLVLDTEAGCVDKPTEPYHADTMVNVLSNQI